MLLATEYVSSVEENEPPNQLKLIEQMDAALIVVGKEWATRPYYTQLGTSRAEIMDLGIQVVYADHFEAEGTHSTDIKKRMRELL